MQLTARTVGAPTSGGTVQTVWVPIAGLLAAANLLFIVVGGFVKADEFGYGWDKTRVGLIVLAVSLLFWMFRHVVQDRTGIRLREDVPQRPPDEAAAPAPATPVGFTSGR